jgi:hypothetical protein
MPRAIDLPGDRVQRLRRLIRGADRMQRVGYQWLVILALIMFLLPGAVEALLPAAGLDPGEGIGAWATKSIIALVTFSFLAANFYIARTYRRTHPQSRGPVLISLTGGLMALANFIPLSINESLPGLTRWAPAIGDLGFIGMGSVSVYAIFKDLTSNRRVNARELWGGVAAYVLIGVIMSYAYGLTAEISPESFSKDFKPGISQRPELLYFSFMTQTTVGYGDLVPTGSLARSLTMIHSMFGMLYPPVIVARLVNLLVHPVES